jgi:hypothetical protein
MELKAGSSLTEMDCSGARLLLLLTETLLCETGGYLLLSKLSALLLTCPNTVSVNKKVAVISIWIRISDFFMARVLLVLQVNLCD